MAVKMNMDTAAEKQIGGAAQFGVTLDVKTEVHVNDGSKAWPTAFAFALCRSPSKAEGSRQDMANLITSLLRLGKPFTPARLSKRLSNKSQSLICEILSKHGYSTINVNTGLDIRDAVKAGANSPSNDNHTIISRFEIDGAWLGEKWYPYERTSSYATDAPWYCFGLRFAGDLIPLKTVLAMRDIGVSQFIQLDEAAQKRATPDQMRRRKALMD
jgi:hypothetical protein